MAIETLSKICLFALITYAMGSDWGRYKVKNGVFMIGWGLALVYSIYNDGLLGICLWAMKATSIIMLLLPVYVFKVIAGADVKAFSVISSFFGFRYAFTVIVVSFIIAALISAVKLISIGKVGFSMQSLADNFRLMRIYGKEYLGMIDWSGMRKHRIHFMVPLWMALVLVMITL